MTSIDSVINWWSREHHIRILLWQCEETRPIIEALDKLEEKKEKRESQGKPFVILKSYIIGLLKPINNLILDKNGAEYYLEGLNSLAESYDCIDDVTIIKKSWMKKKYILQILPPKIF